MCRQAYLLFALLSTSNSATSKPETTDITNDTFTSENETLLNDNECSLYMAQSSIPGAGFGLFTTREVPEGEGILPYADAPNIVVCDYEFFDIEHTDWLHHAYFWGSSGLLEFECASAHESLVTFGAQCNYHTYLMNVQGSFIGYDDEVVDRFVHPSAGAFSYHKGQQFSATRTIMAGEELFADYGESWLNTREGTFADTVPRYDDFVKAGSILGVMRDIYLKSAVEINDEALSVVKNATGVLNKRVASLVPNTKAKFEALVGNHPDEEYSNVIAKSTVVDRGVNWIKENGLCMDNILPGKSTIPLIGQGAFAKRFLVEGSVVSPAPLLQIINSDKMLIYDVYWDEEDFEFRSDLETPIGTQLLINYCFGHKDSKLLLCPQSNAILINHCSSRKNGGNYCADKGPNAKIRWASGWDPDTPTWLEMSLGQISEKTAAKSRGLSFEVIATRDIKPGEEIFIDYGPNWEIAWELHKNQWTPPIEGIRLLGYKPIKNARSKFLLRTVDELEGDPYPDNIVTACYWYEWVEEGYDPDERGYYMANDYIYEGDLDTVHATGLWQCDILKKISPTHYEVRIIDSHEGYDDVLLTMFPQESITLKMKQYTIDEYIPIKNARSKVLLRTVDELEEDPYPDNIVTACYWYEWKDKEYDPDERGYYVADDYIYEGDLDNANKLWQCDILKKITDTHYEVRILRREQDLGDVLLTMFPQESITFRMKRYASDQHIPDAFRHFIEIEDSIFPEQWKTSYDEE